MTSKDNDLRIRPGRIRDGRASGKPQSRFVSDVMRAARKAGHTGYGFSKCGPDTKGSFGRGSFVSARAGLVRGQRRVIIKARIVRHRGSHHRSVSLSKHISYLKRDGVSRDDKPAQMFGRDTDAVDERGFAETCEDDRHHFRFIVSPEDGEQLADPKAFTRDLLARAELDLGTRLEWVAVDHWNTDNPHVHVLVRGKADDGRDLVISRNYISRGLRDRAEHLMQIELGPRNEREIASSLQALVKAERWTDLDRSMRALADDNGGIVDLRRGTPEVKDTRLRQMLIGRAQVLENLNLAEQLAPAVWELKPGAEQTLRDLGTRGDIIKTMHRAMAGRPERATSDFAIEGTPDTPILGRLIQRGLHDDHAGSGYAIIDGIDGRVHHLRFADIEATGDTPIGGIVETRIWSPRNTNHKYLALVGRSDFGLANQVEARGATWLDRMHVARDRVALSGTGFGAEVREALKQRVDNLVAEGLANRAANRTVFSGNLLATLRNRELESVSNQLARESGLARIKPLDGESIAGIYRKRLDLASGRFAMIDNGLGFSLVPWKPQLEKHRDQMIAGTITPGGGVDWTLGRKRGLNL